MKGRVYRYLSHLDLDVDVRVLVILEHDVTEVCNERNTIAKNLVAKITRALCYRIWVFAYFQQSKQVHHGNISIGKFI